MDAVDGFVDEQESRGNSELTRAYYRGNLERFISRAGVRELQDLTPELIADWRTAMQRSGLKPTSIASYDRAVRIWCSWLERNALVSASPFRRVPALKEPAREIIRVLTRDDVRRVMGVAKGSLRNTALIALLLDTGVRAGEVSNLELGDVDHREGLLRVSGKTGDRVVPAHKSLSFLKRYVQRDRRGLHTQRLFTTRSGEGMAARTVTLTVRRLGLAAEVQSTKVGPHVYRHTFAVEYLRNGGDVFSLMRILGHADIKTTERYVSWLASDLSGLHRSKSPGSHWL